MTYYREITVDSHITFTRNNDASITLLQIIGQDHFTVRS